MWVLMFNISADWSKKANFVPVNISYMYITCLRHSSMEHYNLLTLYHFCIQIVKFSTHKMCFKPKLQKMYLGLIITKSVLRRVRNCVGEQVVCLEIVASSYLFSLTIAFT